LLAVQSESAPAAEGYADIREEIYSWTQQGAKISAWLLLGGFSLPLLKHSVIFNSSALVWPWNILGFGVDAQGAAAMATFSIPGHLAAWGLLPAIVATVILAVRRAVSLRGLAAAMFLAGTVSLALMLVVLYKEAEILGLMFTPPTAGAGIMILLVAVGGAFVAGANHLRKRSCEAKPARALSGIGGGLIILLAALQLFASSGGWAAWSMKVLYLLLIGYGILGLLSASRPEPEDALLQRNSFVARAVLWWAPVACFVAQNWQTDPFTGFVTGGGGGAVNILISVAKCFLIYYSFAFLMALGLTAYLEQALLKNK